MSGKSDDQGKIEDGAWVSAFAAATAESSQEVMDAMLRAVEAVYGMECKPAQIVDGWATADGSNYGSDQLTLAEALDKVKKAQDSISADAGFCAPLGTKELKTMDWQREIAEDCWVSRPPKASPDYMKALSEILARRVNFVAIGVADDAAEPPAPPAKPHALQRMTEQPNCFGQSMWRPWE